MAMKLVERLYTQGFISCPHTLGMQVMNLTWDDYVQKLVDDGFHRPQSGAHASDHPPITPSM